MVDWPGSSGQMSRPLLDLALLFYRWPKWHQCKYHRSLLFSMLAQTLSPGLQFPGENTIGFQNLHPQNTRGL